MKKIYITIIVILWITSGISGAIDWQLKRNDLTVSILTESVILGTFCGPLAWLFNALDNDTVLIKK